jgi:hypothetical protein
MAAFGTVKPGFEKAALLQFPQQFSREYARRQLGERYAPGTAAPVAQDYVGNDFFADYHAEKRADAQRSAMEGVGNTRRATNRAMVSHAGYYGMPEPVRHQRRIGADVGNAVGANIYYGAGLSNAAEVSGSALEGGVLGSREGRTWVRNALVKRTAELDAIDAAQEEGPSVQAAVEKGIEPGEVEETEAAVVWQRILQQARSGEFGTDTMSLIPRAIKLLTDMFSVPENLGKIDDYRYEIDDAATAVRSQLVAETQGNRTPMTFGPIREDDDRDDRLYNELSIVRTRETVFNNHLIALDFFRKALEYLEIIGAKTQKGVPSAKELATISRSAAKSVDFPSLLKIRSITSATGRRMSQRVGPRTGATSSSSASSDLSSYGDFGTGASSTFTADGTSYEDSSGPASVYSREDLQDFNQDIFGRQGQRGELRGERNYFGEDSDQSNWRPGITVSEPVPRGFTNIRQSMLATDVDYKEADEDDDSEEAKTARMRDMAQQLGITTLEDIEEAVDEMSPEEGRLMLNRIISRLKAAYTGVEEPQKNRTIPEAKKGLRTLLRKAYA